MESEEGGAPKKTAPLVRASDRISEVDAMHVEVDETPEAEPAAPVTENDVSANDVKEMNRNLAAVQEEMIQAPRKSEQRREMQAQADALEAQIATAKEELEASTAPDVGAPVPAEAEPVAAAEDVAVETEAVEEAPAVYTKMKIVQNGDTTGFN